MNGELESVMRDVGSRRRGRGRSAKAAAADPGAPGAAARAAARVPRLVAGAGPRSIGARPRCAAAATSICIRARFATPCAGDGRGEVGAALVAPSAEPMELRFSDGSAVTLPPRAAAHVDALEGRRGDAWRSRTARWRSRWSTARTPTGRCGRRLSDPGDRHAVRRRLGSAVAVAHGDDARGVGPGQRPRSQRAGACGDRAAPAGQRQRRQPGPREPPARSRRGRRCRRYRMPRAAEAAPRRAGAGAARDRGHARGAYARPGTARRGAGRPRGHRDAGRLAHSGRPRPVSRGAGGRGARRLAGRVRPTGGGRPGSARRRGAPGRRSRTAPKRPIARRAAGSRRRIVLPSRWA